MSRLQKSSKTSFIAMNVFFVSVIILVHGTVAFQLSKIKMNEQLRETSHVIMQQFIMSYNNFETVKAQLVDETTSQFDKEVVKIYKKVDTAYLQKSYDVLYRPISDDDLFDITIRPINERTKRYLKDKIGIEYKDLNPYKMVDYSFKSDGKTYVSKHILVGKSSNNQALIMIEMAIDYSKFPIKNAEDMIENILESNSYLSNISSKFYVVDQLGTLKYATGNKIGTEILDKVDNYTGVPIKDLVMKAKEPYINVFYKSGSAMHQSALRIEFDDQLKQYYILELDQKSIYHKMNLYVSYFWYISLLILSISLTILILLWRKNNQGER